MSANEARSTWASPGLVAAASSSFSRIRFLHNSIDSTIMSSSLAVPGPDMRTGQADRNRPWFGNGLGTNWFPSLPHVHERLSGPARVADFGCGEGWSTIAIAKAYPEGAHGNTRLLPGWTTASRSTTSTRPQESSEPMTW